MYVYVHAHVHTYSHTYIMPMYIHTCHVRKKNEKPSLYWIKKVQIKNHEQLT